MLRRVPQKQVCLAIIIISLVSKFILLTASIIASSEYEEIIEQAVARDPIVTAFSCCEHGVIEKETLADILTSFNAEEHLLDKIKFAVLTDQQVVEKFCDVLASFPEKVELIKKFKGSFLIF